MTHVLTKNAVECHVGDFLFVKFPKLNKNINLVENERAMLESGFSTNRVKIMKIVDLPIAEYNQVSGSLLASRRDMWCDENGSPIGGSHSDDPALFGVTGEQILRNPELLALFQSTCYQQGILVRVAEHPFWHFVVNTEGVDNARYVGTVA